MRSMRRFTVKALALGLALLMGLPALATDAGLSDLSGEFSAVPEGDYIVDALPMGQRVGFRSGLEILDRWVRLTQSRREGEWLRDQALFEKYYA